MNLLSLNIDVEGRGLGGGNWSPMLVNVESSLAGNISRFWYKIKIISDFFYFTFERHVELLRLTIVVKDMIIPLIWFDDNYLILTHNISHNSLKNDSAQCS